MGQNLKIVTYNIHHGSNADAIVNNIAKLASEGVHIFCLQEMRKLQKQQFLLNSLLKILGPEWKAKYLIEPESRHLGLCILWKTPELELKSAEPLLLPKLTKLYFYEKAFQTVANKYEKIGVKYSLPMQRAVLIGDFNFEGKILRIANLHLDWQHGLKHRSLQLRHLITYLKTRPKADFEIICGDFNSLGFYKFYKRRNQKISGLLGKEFINAFHKEPTTSYLQTLDHIFVKNMVVVRAQAIKYTGSDHFPLLAEIKI